MHPNHASTICARTCTQEYVPAVFYLSLKCLVALSDPRPIIGPIVLGPTTADVAGLVIMMKSAGLFEVSPFTLLEMKYIVLSHTRPAVNKSRAAGSYVCEVRSMHH